MTLTDGAECVNVRQETEPKKHKHKNYEYLIIIQLLLQPNEMDPWSIDIDSSKRRVIFHFLNRSERKKK